MPAFLPLSAKTDGFSVMKARLLPITQTALDFVQLTAQNARFLRLCAVDCTKNKDIQSKSPARPREKSFGRAGFYADLGIIKIMEIWGILSICGEWRYSAIRRVLCCIAVMRGIGYPAIWQNFMPRCRYEETTLFRIMRRFCVFCRHARICGF